MWYEHEAEWARHTPAGPVSVAFPVRCAELHPAAIRYLTLRGMIPSIAFGAGWYPGYYRGPRIIIPCRRTDGGTFWQGRLLETAIDADDPTRWRRWDSPPGPRGDALVYLPAASAASRPVVFVTEGPMDALAARCCGYSAVALLGVKPSGAVLIHAASLLQEYPRVVLIPDLDQLGEWVKLQMKLRDYNICGEISLPTDKDLAALSPTERTEFLDAIVA